MPAYIPLSIATFSIIGEKQARTLEPVLATPIRTGELLTGKAVAALVPGVLAGWVTYVGFVLLASLVYGPNLFGVVTDPSWLVGVFVLGPAVGLSSVVAGVVVSSRVNDPRVAQQVGGIIIVPIIAVTLLQATGTLLVGAAGYLLLAAIVFVRQPDRAAGRRRAVRSRGDPDALAVTDGTDATDPLPAGFWWYDHVRDPRACAYWPTRIGQRRLSSPDDTALEPDRLAGLLRRSASCGARATCSSSWRSTTSGRSRWSRSGWSSAPPSCGPSSRLAHQPLPRERRIYGHLLVMAIINITIPFLLITWAEQSVESSLAAILTSPVPLFAIVLSSLFLPTSRCGSTASSGWIVGFIGVVIITSPGLTGAGSSITGELALLGAAFSYACGAVYSRRNVRGLRADGPGRLPGHVRRDHHGRDRVAVRAPVDRPRPTPRRSSRSCGSGCSGRGSPTCSSSGCSRPGARPGPRSSRTSSRSSGSCSGSSSWPSRSTPGSSSGPRLVIAGVGAGQQPVRAAAVFGRVPPIEAA